MGELYKGKYFSITALYVGNRKTPILQIWSDNDDTCIGHIKWHIPWRKFCFFPNEETVWDSKCLEDLTAFLDDYNKEWRDKNGSKKQDNNT